MLYEITILLTSPNAAQCAHFSCLFLQLGRALLRNSSAVTLSMYAFVLAMIPSAWDWVMPSNACGRPKSSSLGSQTPQLARHAASMYVGFVSLCAQEGRVDESRMCMHACMHACMRHASCCGWCDDFSRFSPFTQRLPVLTAFVFIATATV